VSEEIKPGARGRNRECDQSPGRRCKCLQVATWPQQRRALHRGRKWLRLRM